MAKKEPIIGQPTEEQQRTYLSLRDNDPTIVGIYGTKKKYKIRWLRNGQLDKLSRLLIHKKESDNDDEKKVDLLDEVTQDAKLACKASAIYILDGWLKLKLFYWIVWRWFYYVREYREIQLAEILETGKKKIPLVQFYYITTSLTEARGTLMMMTTKEAERTLQEHATAGNSATASNSSGSSSRGTSSSV